MGDTSSSAPSANGLFWARADGGGQPQPLVPGKSISFPLSFSPDGKRLAYYEVPGTPQIWTVPIEQGDGLKAGTPERYLDDAVRRRRWRCSRPMAAGWRTSRTSREELRSTCVPFRRQRQVGGKWQISNNGGTWPIWSPNGREILYRSGDQLMSVAYTSTGDSFSPREAEGLAVDTRQRQAFDLAPDGKRVMRRDAGSGGSAPKAEHTLVFVQNFFDELRRRVPIGK